MSTARRLHGGFHCRLRGTVSFQAVKAALANPVNSLREVEYGLARECSGSAWRVPCDGMLAIYTSMQHIYTTMQQHLNTMHLHRMNNA